MIFFPGSSEIGGGVNNRIVHFYQLTMRIRLLCPCFQYELSTKPHFTRTRATIFLFLNQYIQQSLYTSVTLPFYPVMRGFDTTEGTREFSLVPGGYNKNNRLFIKH